MIMILYIYIYIMIMMMTTMKKHIDDNDNDHDYDDENEHEDGDIIEFYQVDIPVSRSDLSVLTMIGPWWYIPSPKGARGAMAIHLPYLSC